MSELHNPTIAILASGNGSTAEAFIRATQAGQVAAKVGLVICNNPPEKAGIYERIARLNCQYGLDIEATMINSQTHPKGNVGKGQTLAESEAICRRIANGPYGHIALMGYMKTVRGPLIEEYGWKPSCGSIYEGRISNTHPGPLPETENTFGIDTSAQVLQLRLPESKHTLQLVGRDIDSGPIIAEHPVAIRPGDTAEDLFDRVQIVEKAALPYALDKFLREQNEYMRRF